MNTQKLFETIERITGHQCLETEMIEIVNCVEDIIKLDNPCYGCQNCIVSTCNDCPQEQKTNNERKNQLIVFQKWIKENYKHSKGGYRMRGDFENRGTLFSLSQLIELWCRL